MKWSGLAWTLKGSPLGQRTTNLPSTFFLIVLCRSKTTDHPFPLIFIATNRDRPSRSIGNIGSGFDGALWKQHNWRPACTTVCLTVYITASTPELAFKTVNKTVDKKELRRLLVRPLCCPDAVKKKSSWNLTGFLTLVNVKTGIVERWGWLTSMWL